MLLVYVDESGSASSVSPDPNYPIFVMAACLFEADHYAKRLTPDICALKLQHLGSDTAILHESEIRKRLGPFSFSKKEPRRADFLAAITKAVADGVPEVLAVAARPSPESPDLTSGVVESLWELIEVKRAKPVHWVFEKRGAREDAVIGATLRRIAGPDHSWEFAPKLRGLPGLEMADMVARPIGLSVLRPEQPNRALACIKGRLTLLVK
jgi:hypothetical protein